MTLATHASVGLPTGLTSIPGVLALVSDCPRGRPDVFGDSGPWPGSCGVCQLSRAHSANARVPAVSTHSPKRLEFGSKGPRSTCCPGCLGPGPDVPPGLPGVPGDSGSGRRDRGVAQPSRVTRAWVRGPMCSTSSSGQIALGSDGPRGPMARSPGRLGHVPQGPGCRPAVSGTSGPVPRPGIIDQLSRVTRARVRGPTVSTRSSRPSGPGPRARRVHQGSRATRTRVRGPAGSTRSPGRVEHMPDAPRGQPDVPGDSGLAPRAHGVTQLSWDTRALDRRTAGSTS